MNQILQAAAEGVRLGWLMGLMTAFFLAWFIGWTVWAFAPRNKAMMDEVARMPLSDGGDA
jgi:cbb3-type cytochrome oxidase subunit 3